MPDGARGADAGAHSCSAAHRKCREPALARQSIEAKQEIAITAENAAASTRLPTPGSSATRKLAPNAVVGRHPRWARDSRRIAIPPRIRQTTLKLTAVLRVPQFPRGTRSLCGEYSGRLHPEGPASPVTPHPHFPNHFPINHLQLISPSRSLPFWSPR